MYINRNTILFSFGIVLAQDCNTRPYESLLKKVSEVFLTLEVIYTAYSSSLIYGYNCVAYSYILTHTYL